MKFGQLIFPEKSYSKCDGDTRLFSKKIKLSISLDQWSKVLYSSFLFNGKLGAIEIY